MAESEGVPVGEYQRTSRCPLCGGPNRCPLAADPSATECWCEAVEFPDELLALVPEAAKRKICICQECLTNYQGPTKSD
jgi:hypothetical protein